MKKYKKIFPIMATMVLSSLAVVSCNTTNSTPNNSDAAKKYIWDNNLPQGPYFRDADGLITTDKTKSKNYSPESKPVAINLSNPLTNTPIKIDGIEYTPIKKTFEIKWKKKNELKFFSSNGALMKSSRFFREKLNYEKVDTPNNISFENDFTNNYKKIKLNGQDALPTKGEYWLAGIKEVYKFNNKYYRNRDNIISESFTKVNVTSISDGTKSISIDGKMIELKAYKDKASPNAQLYKSKSEAKYYTSKDTLNIAKINNPVFSSPHIKVDGATLPVNYSKIYFKNMNLQYTKDLLGVAGEVPQYFTTKEEVLLDQDRKIKTIHNYQLTKTFPDDLSALQDSSKKLFYNGTRISTFFTWNKKLPPKIYVLKGKKSTDNAFTTNDKLAKDYAPEVAQEIKLPDPNSIPGINIDGKQYQRIQAS